MGPLSDRALSTMGCELAQGYLLGRPADAATISAMFDGLEDPAAPRSKRDAA